MTMTNPAADAALTPEGMPALPVPEMSRRSFLKLLGAAVVVMSVPLATTQFTPADLVLPATSARPADVSLRALPALATSLLQRAFDELRVLGFPFLLEHGNVYQ